MNVHEMLVRAIIALLIAGGAAGAYLLWTRWQLWRVKAGRLGLEDLDPGVPTILYFFTPDCAPCRVVQGPAIESLQAAFGDRLQVVKINAVERPDLADYWGVLSVPTTFIVDKAGEPRGVNHGVASADKLRRQLEEVSDREPAPQANEIVRVSKAQV
jgi:thioredoxin-like negative regulator of GroEL